MTDPRLAFPEFSPALRARADAIREALRSGVLVPDPDLDVLFPDAVHEASFVHGTPVRVAARIVELLGLGPSDRVLDVGSGAGKFCLVATAMCGARVRGVERDPRLVAVAREAARRLRLDATFEEGSFTPAVAEGVDVVYLFNPFTPTPFLAGSWPGRRRGPRGTAASERASVIASVSRFLEQAKRGLRVVTFCGFGGPMPASYVQRASETWDDGALEVWEKRAAARSS